MSDALAFPLRRWAAGVYDAVRPGREGNILFVHPPKCGGNSIYAALCKQYPRAARTKLAARASKIAADRLGVDLHAYRSGLLRYELERGGTGRLVSGHYPVDAGIIRDHGGRWTLVTLLRDPVERFISHYFYNRDAGGPFNVDLPLEAFVQTERARGWGRIFVRQFGGHDADLDAAVEAAVETLAGFDVVGTLEDVVRFRTACDAALGFDLPLGRRNVGPVTPEDRAAAVTPEVRQRISTLCEPDARVRRRALAGASRIT